MKTSIASIPLTLDEVKSHLIETKFIVPTAHAYNSLETSSKGFQTYGPNGFALKNKIINLWRNMFVHTNVHEIDTPVLQSKDVLTNSGHVGRFNDLIISNGKDIYRADHLVKKYTDEHNIQLTKPVDDFTKDELLDFVKRHKAIEDSNIATIAPKNLMFGAGDMYLRPEIAQGMFTEFDQFHEHVYSLPFGLAQVGKSFRNEISCHPFTRLKEFTQAEVEYFFDPHDESHPNFNMVSGLIIPLYTQDLQLANATESMYMDIMNAVKSSVIINEIMGYFLGTVYNFALALGIPSDSIRFRQHLSNELSHYARQCWDLEIRLANGQWLECVGCAHRGNYDLTNHNIEGQNFIKKYSTKVEKYKVILNKKTQSTPTGISKENVKNFYSYFQNILFDSEENVLADKTYQHFEKLSNGCTEIVKMIQNVESTVIPYVIEPSVGIDRIIFAIANNLLKKREGDLDRILFCIPLRLAPYDLAIFALSKDNRLIDFINKKLIRLNNSFKVHYDFSSTSIGKRYVRVDSIGIPYVITVDFESLIDNAVTIRKAQDGYQFRYSVEGLEDQLKFLMSITTV